MKRRQFPWFVVVIAIAPAALAQSGPSQDTAATVGDPVDLRSASRDGRSISLSGESGRGDVPEFHDVTRGDTLWDITGYYFSNPWRWPALWGLNPQITNPHWIFPRDRVRLLREGTARAAAAPASVRTPTRTVTPDTVFHLNNGYLDPQEAESAGTVVGSSQDHMLLSEGDEAYVEFARRTPRVGERFALYQDAQDGQGDRNTGHVVRLLGSVEVTRWDERRRLATVRITEALDPIERGERVAAIPRTVRTVPPVRNAINLEARIAATLRPSRLVGQHQIVFLDRGQDDRVQVGNRFLVVRRGDAWRRTLDAVSERQASGGDIDRDGDGRTDTPPGAGQDPNDRMPEEIVGEALVVEIRRRTCTAIVTSATIELSVGERAVLRRGY